MNTYEIVTERIINLLEQGVVPWRLLSATKYISPYWLTLKQANELGGSVRKGEQSQIVVFWRVDHISNSEAEPDPEKLEADEKSRRRFVLRYYRLWVRREVA